MARSMKILLIHNEYRIPGGEDVVVNQLSDLLLKNGNEIVKYKRSNKELDLFEWWQFLLLPLYMIVGYRINNLPAILKREKPDVVHFHNTFLMISPRALRLCKNAGFPVVLTLHNYRLICARADFFRSGKVCEDCIGRTFPWPGVAHACYHASRVQTTMVAGMLFSHRLMKTWLRNVDIFVCLTEFARLKFIAGGLPSQKLVVNPNFVSPDPGARVHAGDFALFVGRFSPEEKMQTLFRAWREIPDLPLKLAGGERNQRDSHNLLARSHMPRNVEWVGRHERKEVLELMRQAMFVVFPSEWFEGFPLVIAEAFACGVPVIASGIGSLLEIVEDGRTGLFFSPGDASDLVTKVKWAQTHPREMIRMGRNARAVYESKYSEAESYRKLIATYTQAVLHGLTSARNSTNPGVLVSRPE